MTANDFFAFMFGLLRDLFNIGFVIFGYEITLWGLFLAGVICTFLFRVLFAYIFGY